ncbi:unnamed protein product [Boreogadus saida]
METDGPLPACHRHFLSLRPSACVPPAPPGRIDEVTPGTSQTSTRPVASRHHHRPPLAPLPLPPTGSSQSGAMGQKIPGASSRWTAAGREAGGGVGRIGGGSGGSPSYRPSAHRRRHPELRGPDFSKPTRLDLLLDMPWPGPRQRMLRVTPTDPAKPTAFCAKANTRSTWADPLAGAAAGHARRGGRGHGGRRRCTRWATRRWWARTRVVGLGLGRNSGSTTTARTGARRGALLPCFLEAEEGLLAARRLLVVLDMDEGTLSFMWRDTTWAWPSGAWKGRKLYPVVSAVWGHCEITMKYVNGLDREPAHRASRPRGSVSGGAVVTGSPAVAPSTRWLRSGVLRRVQSA